MIAVKRALLSVTDKTGLVEFARRLQALNIEMISTGGTARTIRDAGMPVLEVSEVTGFPEILDGRVKTLHPAIAAALLADTSNPEHMRAIAQQRIEPIQLVVVNLYEFEKVAANPDAKRADLIENIDIGGPTMIRAAAKNHGSVGVVTAPSQYETVAAELESHGSLTDDTSWRLAREAFARTAAYDTAISHRLNHAEPAAILPDQLHIDAPRLASLRYGENPHQQAALYRNGPDSFGIAGAQQLGGKELSYNNLVDLDAAWSLISEFAQPAAVIVKHTNPCGCAVAATVREAYIKAFEADPVSAFGGVLAFNREVDAIAAAEIAKLFVEAIAAPGYEEAALSILSSKKNLRLLRVRGSEPEPFLLRSISGGILAQTPDAAALDAPSLQVKTKREPNSQEMGALQFAWKVAKHVKSNAIVFAREFQLIAAGAGQMSRVDAVKVGAMKAVLPLAGSVLASDAFFPFPDGLEQAASYGVTAAIQPGGSVRDAEVIAAADRLDIAMVFTGVRHFLH